MFKTDAKTAIDLDLGDIRRDLEAAIHEKQFGLDYQPVYSLALQRTVYAEALLRWNHPRWGALSPRVFLPVAEEMGLTDALSVFVLRTTCAQTARWRETLEIPLCLSLNVSAQQLHRAAFPVLTASALAEAGLPHSALLLEISTRDFDQLDEQGVANLRSLGDAGVGLCLDNFRGDLGTEPGPGWSSVVVLKTASDLVRDVEKRPRLGAAVRAVLTYGEALGLAVVIKGVETPQQLDWLAEHCPQAAVQGYAVSPALSAGHVTEWIGEQAGLTV